MGDGGDGGEVKLVAIAKFKEEVNEEEIEVFIKGYKELVEHVKPLKYVEYGKDIGSTTLQQGFTHVLLCTFENKKGVEEFMTHQAHIDFKETQGTKMENFIVLDYQPTKFP